MTEGTAEDLRVREIAELALLDTPLDPVAERICRITSELFRVPMAFVSLIDATHHHLIAGHGVDLGCTPREEAICNIAIGTTAPLIIEDTLRDSRTRHNRFVVALPNIRSYVGIPLGLTPNVPLGAFCIADVSPRVFSEHELSLLHDQAAIVASLVRERAGRQELARRTIELSDKTMILAQAENLAGLGGFEADPGTGAMLWTHGLHAILGVDASIDPTIETFLRVFDRDTRRALRRHFTKIVAEDADFEIESTFTDAFGRRRDAKIHAAVRNDERGRRIVGIVLDISDRRTAMNQLEWTATHDHLTKVLNRAAFVERVGTAMRQAETLGCGVALFTLDLDRFRIVNDTLGHDVGDALLLVVAERLMKVVGKRGLIARIGGNEFAILVERYEAEGRVAALATEVLLALRTPASIAGSSLDTRATIGIALHSIATTCAGDLLKEADIALTHAREAGRDGFTFYRPAMRDALEARAIRLAVARAAVFSGHLEAWYQPKIELGTNRILGFEALMRWYHPALGLCGPDAMGDVFGDTEIATAVGRVMLYRVAADMFEWRRQRLPFGRIAINAAEAELRASDYAERVLGFLTNQHLTPNVIEIEVTESVFLGSESGVVAQTLRKLAEAGVSIALDDFGTGYASLTHLKQYPVSTIKIDRSFVADIESDQDAATIVEALTSLAHSLKLGVVAEGIETVAQLEFLKRRGCGAGQGYLFAKPMPASRVPHFIRAWIGKADEQQRRLKA